jgi:hypothetical protein
MDFLDVIFTSDEAVIAANKAELARIAAVEAAAKAADAARRAELAAMRCPKCMGEGRLPQFAHRNGGVCYTCGGSGIFSRLAA